MMICNLEPGSSAAGSLDWRLEGSYGSMSLINVVHEGKFSKSRNTARTVEGGAAISVEIKIEGIVIYMRLGFRE